MEMNQKSFAHEEGRRLADLKSKFRLAVKPSKSYGLVPVLLILAGRYCDVLRE
ncbi:hypothetical protein AVEN_132397-1, partial [Araneus ventricosus]